MRFIPAVLAALFLLIPARPASALEVTLHPLCVQQMVWLNNFHFDTEAADALPAKACNEFYRKAPVEIKGQFYSSKFGGIKAKNLPVYEYRIVGYHRNLTVVNLQESVGSADGGGAALYVAGPADWRDTARKLEIEQILMVDEDGTVKATPALARRLSLEPDVRFEVID